MLVETTASSWRVFLDTVYNKLALIDWLIDCFAFFSLAVDAAK